MQCRNVEARIQELLDDRFDPSIDPELNAHADTCAECRDLLAVQALLLEGVSRLAVPSLPPDFSQRAVGIAVVRQSPARRFSPAAAFLAIIATLLLVFALGPQQRRGDWAAEGRVAAVSHPQIHQGGHGLLMADFDSAEVRVVIEQLMTRLTSDGARFYQVDQLAGTIRPKTACLGTVIL